VVRATPALEVKVPTALIVAVALIDGAIVLAADEELAPLLTATDRVTIASVIRTHRRRNSERLVCSTEVIGCTEGERQQRGMYLEGALSTGPAREGRGRCHMT
jgi:hypothetical protein